MTHIDLIVTALADGVTLRLDSGKLKVAGERTAVNQWLPLIRERKAALIEALVVEAAAAITAPQLDADSPLGTDPAWLVPLADGTDAEAAILALFDGDDRRRCTDCLHLLKAVCRIAKPGGLVSASKGYRPMNLPMRCAGYAAKVGDADQRPGAYRWPGLTPKVGG